jgi:4-hydroxybenzoate polyprenyltransferase
LSALAALASGRGALRLALAAAASALALGYAYGVNAVADRATDEASSKNPLAGSAGVPAEVLAAVAASAVSAIAVSLFLGAFALGLTLASLSAATFYSIGPRLKALPILGLLFNTAIFAPLLGLAVPDQGAPPAFGVLCSTFTALILQNQLLHESADEEEDARGGVLTTARLLGPRATRTAVLFIAAPGIAIAIALAPAASVAWAAGIAIALCSLAALSASPARGRVVHRWLSAACGFMVFLAGISP